MTDTLTLYAFNTGWFQCKPGYFIEGERATICSAPCPPT